MNTFSFVYAVMIYILPCWLLSQAITCLSIVHFNDTLRSIQRSIQHLASYQLLHNKLYPSALAYRALDNMPAGLSVKSHNSLPLVWLAELYLICFVGCEEGVVGEAVSAVQTFLALHGGGVVDVQLHLKVS